MEKVTQTPIFRADELQNTGKLLWELGDFPAAIAKLNEAAEIYASQGDHKLHIKCLTLNLRMYAEMEDQAAIQKLQDQLHEYVSQKGIELNSTTYYTMALVCSYRGEYTKALELLEKALALALASDSKEDMCYAIHGLAAVYWSLGRTEDALKEIYNLRVFFQVLSLPHLEISSQILNGYILVSLKRIEDAIDVFWKTFDALKANKNMHTYVSLLFAMGYAYSEAGDSDLAKTYLRLAHQMTNPKVFVFLHRKIQELNQKMSGKADVNYDIVFNNASNSVVERKKGRIDFKNQFILLDMLKLFLKHPGEVYSKEELVQAVWRQEYDPSVHDNKIYVTIKRLRQLIEPDFDKPKYIYRAKNGYYLNRNARISFEQ